MQAAYALASTYAMNGDAATSEGDHREIPGGRIEKAE